MTVLIIKAYQALLGFKKRIFFSVFGYVSYCKHQPCCSEYTIREIKKHGTILGLWRGLKRVATCY